MSWSYLNLAEFPDQMKKNKNATTFIRNHTTGGKNGPRHPPGTASISSPSCDHAPVLSQEEHGELHAAVFVWNPPTSSFSASGRSKEAVHLGERRHQEDQEADGLEADVPDPDWRPPRPRDSWIRTASARPRREHETQLVAEHLSRGAKPSEERVLAVRATPEHNPVDAQDDMANT